MSWGKSTGYKNVKLSKDAFLQAFYAMLVDQPTLFLNRFIVKVVSNPNSRQSDKKKKQSEKVTA